MDFFLVRHGDAKADFEDPMRPLSERGRSEVERVARAVAEKGIRVFEVLHSDKLRAKQTAEILARSLSPLRGVRETMGLSPQDDPLVVKAEIEAAQEPLMLVGHLPHLNRLASLLVAGDSERDLVDFPTAAIVCLSCEIDKWKIEWALTPRGASEGVDR